MYRITILELFIVFRNKTFLSKSHKSIIYDKLPAHYFFMTLHIHFNYKNSIQSFVFMCRSYRSLFMKMVLVSVETIEIICFMKTFRFQSSCTLSFSTDLDIRSINYRNRLKIGFEKEVYIYIYCAHFKCLNGKSFSRWIAI